MIHLHLFLVFIFTALLVFSNPIVGHPGPERHPIEQELVDLGTALREEMGSLVSEIEAKINTSAGLVDEIPQGFVDSVNQRLEQIESAQNGFRDSIDQALQPIQEIKDQLNFTKNEPNDSPWLWTFALFGTVGNLLMGTWMVVRRSKNNRVSKGATQRPYKESKPSFDQEKQDHESGEDYTEETNEEEGEQESKIRIVTHTRKGSKKSEIKELYNPDADWSPRTVEDAIKDIDNEEFVYITRGPKGNEAKIVVGTSSKSNRYLKTESDEHEGNNLSELPDPPVF